MPIVFSPHAKRQLKKRYLSQKLAKQVVREYEKKISSFRGRSLRRKQIDGKMIEIVTKTEGSRITVITGYVIEE